LINALLLKTFNIKDSNGSLWAILESWALNVESCMFLSSTSFPDSKRERIFLQVIAAGRTFAWILPRLDFVDG
jgi:hypothetical protein